MRFWMRFLSLSTPCSQNLLFLGMQVNNLDLLDSIVPPLYLQGRIGFLVLLLFVVILLVPYSDRFLFGCYVASCYIILQVPHRCDAPV